MVSNYNRILLVAFCISCCNLSAFAQLDCGVPFAENLRPDTIKNYTFNRQVLPITQFPGSKPLSEYSFTTKYFKLVWFPFMCGDRSVSIGRTLNTNSNRKILDTITMNLYADTFDGYLVKEDRRLCLLMFSRAQKYYTVIVTIRKQKFIDETLNYLKEYFN